MFSVVVAIWLPRLSANASMLVRPEPSPKNFVAEANPTTYILVETRTPAPSAASASEETSTLSASFIWGAPSRPATVTLLVKVLTPDTVCFASSRFTLADSALSDTLPGAEIVDN